MATLTVPRPPAPLLTIEDVLAMPDNEDYELIDGVLKERAMSNASENVAAKVVLALGPSLEALGGEVFANGPRLPLWPRRPNHFVKPDVSYYAPDQFEGDSYPDGPTLPIPPALVVEVISPGDRSGDIAAKIADYLDAGVRLLWVVYPDQRQVHVYQPGKRVEFVQDGEELTGGDVLPGFRCDLARLMPPLRVRSDA